jgi:4-alpha-glucanotransferase
LGTILPLFSNKQKELTSSVRSVDPLSVDTWISPELFRLGKQTGAPPDAFSTTGQNWGFPTYDWAAMKRENFRWWRRRLECMAQYFGA